MNKNLETRMLGSQTNVLPDYQHQALDFCVTADCQKALRPVQTRELVPAVRSYNTLPEHSSLVCTNDF